MRAKFLCLRIQHNVPAMVRFCIIGLKSHAITQFMNNRIICKKLHYVNKVHNKLALKLKILCRLMFFKGNLPLKEHWKTSETLIFGCLSINKVLLALSFVLGAWVQVSILRQLPIGTEYTMPLCKSANQNC